MRWDAWLVGGFGATVVLTTILAGSQGLGLTRMNIPYLLGTIFTPNRDRAKVYGVLLHLLFGWIFSLAYVGAFEVMGDASWWLGAAIGFVHGAFALGVVMPILPGIHPRMASEVHGPTVVRQLEPPGFLARNYGNRTPITVQLAHTLYGVVLGVFYPL